MDEGTRRLVDIRAIVRGLPEGETQGVEVSAAAPAQGDQLAQSYESIFREAIAESGSIYGSMEAMPLTVQASHERRIELLEQLPLGDLREKVCLDYGVGSWGFACIFPKLQHCAYAIGIDISYEAIKESARISAAGTFPYGKNFFYLTSRGDDIRLQDQSVDVVFAGECIEHIENTGAFLEEIHRILTPGGRLILTTPNSDAYFYRVSNDRYGVGPEHVALMSYAELMGYLEGRFDVEIAYGFNGSLYREWDERVRDRDVAQALASMFEDRPDLGTGVIVMARRRDDHISMRYSQQYYHHSAPEVRYSGTWKTVPLHREMTGALASGEGAALSLDFQGEGLIINLWCHSWSGMAEVVIDGVARPVDLYSPVGGFTRLVFADLGPGPHYMALRGGSGRNPSSHGSEFIFYQAVSYKCG